MQSKKPYSTAKMVFAIFVTFWLASAHVSAQTRATKFKVLYTFHGLPKDGAGGNALVIDADGSLYGTAGSGGSDVGVCGTFGGCGTAFKLDKGGRRVWQHSFQFPKGFDPDAGLLRDKAGNLYGTTYLGGDTQCPEDQYGCGTVFKLDDTGKETVLHKFTGTPDGWFPDAPVVEDDAGNLYGTTQYGGPNAYGAVFKVDKSGRESVLYSFTGGSDGCDPRGVILDSAGNLYGVTEGGGSESCSSGGDGVVFKLGATGDFTVLHTFGGSDGAIPVSVLLLDAGGNLYGTTTYGGNSECGGSGCGVVFKLSPSGTETVLYTFCSLSNCVDGERPLYGPLVRDSKGNLYGTTIFGGTYSDCNGGTCGTVFKLDAGGSETVLHNFTGKADGDGPEAGLTIDRSGNLYGTTVSGGDLNCEPSYGCGVVFKITP
jgi:uncharacterized repeat protein (TIGR03803 family)